MEYRGLIRSGPIQGLFMPRPCHVLDGKQKLICWSKRSLKTTFLYSNYQPRFAYFDILYSSVPSYISVVIVAAKSILLHALLCLWTRRLSWTVNGIHSLWYTVSVLLGVLSLIFLDSIVLLHLPCALIFSISSSNAFILSW